MREHVRELIHRARHGTDARRARQLSGGSEGVEALAADAVRLARLATAVHAAEAARRLVDHAAELESAFTGEHVR